MNAKVLLTLMALCLSMSLESLASPAIIPSPVDLSTPQNIHSDCGGVVTITNEENPIIEYKVSGNYGNNERCIWSIVPKANLTLSKIVVYIDRLNFYNTGDGIILYSWAGASNSLTMTRKIITSDLGVSFGVGGERAFLYFSSDGVFVFTGFRVSIIGVKTTQNTLNHQALNFVPKVKCPVNYFYPSWPLASYQPGARVSIVLQPNMVASSSTNLTLQYLSTEGSYDYLEIYSLPPYIQSTNLVLDGRYSGICTSAICKSVMGDNPRIILFSSTRASSNQNRGFQFSWI